MLTEQISGNKSATVQQTSAHSTAKEKICWLSKVVSFQNNLGANEYRKDRRLHGLQLPLHPLQIVGWLTLVVFVLTTYLVLIPAFHANVRLPLYAVVSVLLVIHVATHIAALLIDPADIELRKISTRKVVPEFDRAKHSHVIENGRCHLCNIKTSSPRTKHCSVCNKCVQTFDHHCKYLNSCVSKTRNYVPFLMCVVSAVLCVLVILAAALAQIVLFYVNPSWLNLWDKSVILAAADSEDESVIETQITEIFNATSLWNDTLSIENATLSNSTTTRDAEVVEGSGIGLYNTIFLAIVGIVAILAAVTAGLLLHLCFFHVYICYLGLTTYEYIRNHRTTTAANTTTTAAGNNRPSELAAKEIYICSKLKSSDIRHRPKTLYCCEDFDANDDDNNMISNSIDDNRATGTTVSQKAFYVCTVLEETTMTTTAAAAATAASESAVINANDSNSQTPSATRTLHCCSEFSHITKSHNGIRKVVQYSEECAFCSFRIKTPRKLEHQKQRCCTMKTNISKHHRWRRKWNCCSNVPNSPEDAPALHTIYNNQPLSSSSGAAVAMQPPKYVQIEIPIDNCANNFTTNHRHHSPPDNNGTYHHHQSIQSIATISSSTMTVATCSTNMDSISSAAKINNNAKRTQRSKLVRPWPVRLRHVFRMINRYRRPRGCRGSAGTPKQNQVRPLSGSNSSDNINGNYNGLNGDTQFEQHHQSTAVPNAPAPNRRKLKDSSPSDLQDLADSLSIIQPATQVQVPSLQNMRRQRRKNVLRNNSPKLSPIHESGFSNPASPQLACRHACTGSIPSIAGTGASLCGNNLSNKRVEN
jgi:hypothetical protein